MLTVASDEVSPGPLSFSYEARGSRTEPAAAVPHASAVAAEGREAERLRQRAFTERLLLGALRERDVAGHAVEAERQAKFLVSAGRDLAMALDCGEIREIVRRCTLPRAGSWCIVDLVESSGAIHRLAAIHPDPAKQPLARTLEDSWIPATHDAGAGSSAVAADRKPMLVTSESPAALTMVAHGERNLEILNELGFAELLVVPLVVRGSTLGAITFVTREGDAPLSRDEITLASDLAERAAIALDNARLYAEANELRKAADLANRGKSRFLGNISHELLTPLNAIGGYADLMEMEIHGPVTSEQRFDLERIKQSQRHLVALISQILEYVHSESGLVELRPAPVSLNALVREVVDMLAPAAKRRDLVIDVRRSDGGASVWADPVRLRQILVNLVTNAVKYSPAGGGRIQLSITAAPKVVNVLVSDSGPGIPADKLERIFEPFVQLKSGFSNRQGGVGLGLAISRDLARAMKGDITVESTPGAGARFTLTLPRAPMRVV